jgi:UrcA family protein
MTKSGLLILATIFATGAIAQPRQPQPPAQSETVAYTDLDLASRAGQTVLRHRIELAAGRVCDSSSVQKHAIAWQAGGVETASRGASWSAERSRARLPWL